MSDNHLTNIQFQSLDLPDSLKQGIAELGYSHCTPIQAQSLPLLLKGQDVAGQAQTGTGKTAAFLVAMFDRLLRKPAPATDTTQPRGVIIAPTRELAVQIHKDAVALARHTGLRIAVIYGGTGYESQQETLRQGVDVLIGTPGRMIDFFKQRLYGLKAVEAVVLDEADRMFDLGFINDIRYLLRRMPPPSERLTMLFSATLSFRVMELAYEHMNNPQLVRIETDKITADKVQQSVYYTSNEEKIPLLLGLLKRLQPPRTIVFVNTKNTANRVSDYLRFNGFDAEVLSGDVPQKKRLSLLKAFQQGELAILVATDVAARGLHIPDITHVINFDLPQDAEDYVHRIGRTARAGASGVAISFACEDYAFYLPDIEAYVQHKLPVEAISDDLLMTPQVPPKRPRKRPERRGGRPGGRSGAPRRSSEGRRRGGGRRSSRGAA